MLRRLLSSARLCSTLAPAFSAASPLQVCVVGSGPAGFYTVDRLLHRFGDAVREALPVPGGLVRFGVAPDHPETKAVGAKFERLASDPRVGLLLGVRVGGDVALPQLRARYHAVVLAVGAPAEKPLACPGAALANVLPATAFVRWYNGHPDGAAPFAPPRLDGCSAALVLGMGNVALDVARMLLRPPASLAHTDVADGALAALAKSGVRVVTVAARRGPAQAACTPREVRELCSLPDVVVACDQLGEEQLGDEDRAELASSRQARRTLQELRAAVAASAPARAAGAAGEAAAAAAGGAPGGGPRLLRLLFLRSVAELLPSSPDGGGAAVGAALLTRNVLSGPAGARAASVAPGGGSAGGGLERVGCGLVVSSLGQRGAPLRDAPFDPNGATFPHDGGAVRSGGPGLYAVGWAKRGAAGLVGANLSCAEETVATLARDAAAGALPRPLAAGGVAELAALAAAGGARPVSLAGWRRIDATERAAGAAAPGGARPRVKVASLEEMHRLAGAFGDG